MSNKLPNNPLDLKGELLKTKNNDFDFTIPDIETKKEDKIILKEEKKQEKKIEKPKEEEDKVILKSEKESKKPKTYRFTPQLIEDMDKIVYMDRELRGNETTLVTKAIENYIYSKEGKEFIRQYDELKGSK